MRTAGATLERKPEVNALAPEATDKCSHFWVIESPNGPTSRGVCRLCGTEREFNNSIPYKVVGK